MKKCYFCSKELNSNDLVSLPVFFKHKKYPINIYICFNCYELFGKGF